MGSTIYQFVFKFNICIPDLSANIKSKREKKNTPTKDQVANRGRNIEFTGQRMYP